MPQQCRSILGHGQPMRAADMSSIAHSRPSVTIQAAFCMGCVVYEALKTLNLNEAKWAMERVILWAVGSLAHFDYTITEIGDTRKYRFFLDGWVFRDVVLSPTETGGRWGYSDKLIWASDGQNSERLAAYKKAVMQLPEWQRELYSELPDFTHIAQQLDMRLQQEWGGLVTAKRDSAAKDEDEAIKRPQEHPDRAAKKDKILDLWKGGHNLTDISSITGIPYSSLKVLRDELIDEGRLPKEAKKSKGGLGTDSI